MIKVSVFYPQKAGAKFDMDYYCDSHMPLLQSTLKPAMKGMAVDKGLAGGAPGSDAMRMVLLMSRSVGRGSIRSHRNYRRARSG